MFPAYDGLPSITQTSYLRLWEWRCLLSDNSLQAIFFLGALQNQDIRLRYWNLLPDLVLGTPSPYGDGTATGTFLPVVRAGRTLAHYIAWAFANARGSPLAAGFLAEGDNALNEMLRSTSRRKQRGSHRRRPYGGYQIGNSRWGLSGW